MILSRYYATGVIAALALAGYSQAAKVGKTLYVSGTVAVDPEGRLVGPGDMRAQLEAAYANLGRTLEVHAATFEQVVRERIRTTDMQAPLAAREPRFNYYPRNVLPATTWVQVAQLVVPGFLVAIEVTAELP